MQIETRLTTIVLTAVLASGCGSGNMVAQADSQTELATETVHESVDVPDLRTRVSGDDWPGFLGPTGDSKSRETGIITDWTKNSPRIVWHKRLGESYGMPSISRGRLFMFHRFGDQARLSCWNSETGEELWNYQYPTDYVDYYRYGNGPRCCPVVDEERVYIHGAEGMLTCLRVTDGELLWKVDTQADFGVKQNFFGVGSVPVVEGDLLIVMVGGSPADSPAIRSGAVEPNGSGVAAFDKHTGEVRYAVGDELASYASPMLATIDDRRWCFAFARGGLLGFEPSTGKIDFHFPWRARIVESVNAANPVVVGNHVFISEAYDYSQGSCLLRVRPGACEVVWRDEPRSREKAMQSHFVTPVYVDGYLYGSSARHSSDAQFKCIEFLTGRDLWSVDGWGWTSPLYVDGHFVTLSEDGMLRLIKADPMRFQVAARKRLTEESSGGLNAGGTNLIEPPAWAAPILSHGLLYVRGEDRLVCLELIPEE